MYDRFEHIGGVLLRCLSAKLLFSLSKLLHFSRCPFLGFVDISRLSASLRFGRFGRLQPFGRLRAAQSELSEEGPPCHIPPELLPVWGNLEDSVFRTDSRAYENMSTPRANSYSHGRFHSPSLSCLNTLVNQFQTYLLCPPSMSFLFHCMLPVQIAVPSSMVEEAKIATRRSAVNVRII